jgi:hypothetical protein
MRMKESTGLFPDIGKIVRFLITNKPALRTRRKRLQSRKGNQPIIHHIRKTIRGKKFGIKSGNSLKRTTHGSTTTELNAETARRANNVTPETLPLRAGRQNAR